MRRLVDSYDVTADPFFRQRWLVLGKAGEQFARVSRRYHNAAVLRPYKALGYGVVEQLLERREIVEHVQAAARFVMDPELCPGENFAQFFVGAQPTGESHKGIGEFRHQGFSLVHRGDDPQAGDTTVRQLAIDEHLRNDANDFTAGSESRIRQDAHQAHVAGTIDNANAALG